MRTSKNAPAQWDKWRDPWIDTKWLKRNRTCSKCGRRWFTMYPELYPCGPMTRRPYPTPEIKKLCPPCGKGGEA